MKDSELREMRQSVQEMLRKMRGMPVESQESDGVVLHANNEIAIDNLSGPTGARWVSARLKVTNEDGIHQCRDMITSRRRATIYAHVMTRNGKIVKFIFPDAIVVNFEIAGFIGEVVEVTLEAKTYTEEKT